MSTSPRLAPDARAVVLPFCYMEATVSSEPVAEVAADLVPLEDVSRREAAVREAGRVEGEAQARAVYEQQLLSIHEKMRATLSDFAQERKAYYRQVEGEVVSLAMNIARKVLRREAQIDPLLLAGLVRMVLEQMSGTKVVVRVCPSQLAEFRGFFARTMNADTLPEVEEDATLEPEHCCLHTSMGTTQLGVEVQLKEIERGLLDLLAQRPQVGE
jgi:flagellar assembly protein FliH